MKPFYRLAVLSCLAGAWVPDLQAQLPRRGGRDVVRPAARDVPARRPVLKVRSLKDKSLTQKQKNTYESALADVQKRAKYSSRISEQARKALGLLAQGGVDLEFGQEQLAADTLHEAWGLVVDCWQAEPKTISSQTKYLQKHFTSFRPIIKEDASLALTILEELDGGYAAGEALASKSKRLSAFGDSLAELWGRLAHEYELDGTSLEKALFWISLAPDRALTDKSLKGQERADYQAALSQAELEFDQLRQRLQRTGMHQPVGVGRGPSGAGIPQQPGQGGAGRGKTGGRRGAAGQLDQAMANARQRDPADAGGGPGGASTDSSQREQLVLMMLGEKRVPLTLFCEALAHIRHEQQKRALLASHKAWTLLLSYDRQHPNSMEDFDDDAHLELLDHLKRHDRVCALAFMQQLDDLYRRVGSGRPSLVFELADRWSELFDQLPLSKRSLETAAAWLEQAGRLRGKNDRIYTQKSRAIKQRLDELNKPPAAVKPANPLNKPPNDKPPDDAEDQDTEKKKDRNPKSRKDRREERARIR